MIVPDRAGKPREWPSIAIVSDPAAESSLVDAAEVFGSVRPRLFGIAYRMLGSWTEAEDVVQDAWLRWQNTDRTVVQNPGAFLATTTTRLALNVAQSARARRETYIGPWLPEPVDTSADPTIGAERDQAVELAVLFLLEKLTPTERAAYILRESFGYAYAEIADILQTGQANARQLVSRARKHLDDDHREPVDPATHRQLLEAFLRAAQSGDLEALERLLAADVVSYTDGNGARQAARVPVVGRRRVAALLVAFQPRFWPGARTEWVDANGQVGVLILSGDTPLGLLTLRASAEGIDQLQWQLNPTKIAAFLRSANRFG
ncbi:RNA polymerase sigma-70 factor [Microlunatus aurantiacus]|uniref:RNA polymerase sigma-70 factor n=1 Tax=Microlunatus aurantiacus TaxID=446786 RepID=A0ABP7DA17_9ACTN